MRRSVYALVALFALRLAVGLSADFFTEDESQIFLLGLRFHAGHAWPYFGPDVVWTKSQIPGALQAMLVGLPLAIAPVPEAPYVFLNLLSMAALCLFAAYLCARLPTAPRWLIWGWVLTVPWTLHFSTHIMNPDYVLPASVIFFIGFFEAWPPLSIGRIRTPFAHAMQGAAICWIAQVHLSWPLLLPFVFIALAARLREGARATTVAALALAAGAAITGSLLLPTVWTLGLAAGSGTTEQNLHLHWREPISTFTKTAARVLSFASLETNRFIGDTSAKQILFLWDYPWAAPATLVTGLAGIAQPLWMAVCAFRTRSPIPGWSAIRWLTIGTIVLISSAFFVVMEPAQARMYYLVTPLSLAYAAYCWTWIDSPRWRRFAAVLMAANLAFEISLTVAQFPGASIYQDRTLIAEAVRTGQDSLFTRRRAFAKDATADDIAAAQARSRAAADFELSRAVVTPRAFGFTSWDVRIRNVSTTSAYRDIVLATTYRKQDGGPKTQLTFISTVIQPGETRELQIVDGMKWTAQTVSAEARVEAALALTPLSGVKR